MLVLNVRKHMYRFSTLIKKKRIIYQDGKSNKMTKCPFQTPIMSFYYAPRKFSGEHIVAALSVRPSVSQSVRPSVRPIRVLPITLLFEVGFRNHFREMTTMFRRRVARNIWVPILKVKVTARPCSKIVSGQ